MEELRKRITKGNHEGNGIPVEMVLKNEN